MKKSEMEWHFNRLRDASLTIDLMLRQRPIDLSVFDCCVETFEHIIPAVRYWTKEQPEGELLSVVPYWAIATYGPALFAHDAIVAMCDHIGSSRYLKKSEFPFVQMTEDLQRREHDAVDLWNWIESSGGREQRGIWRESGVDQQCGSSTLQLWEQLSIVVRTPTTNSHSIEFVSDLSAPAIGICPNCGVKGKARRELLYKCRSCPRCGEEVYYHLVQPIEA